MNQIGLEAALPEMPVALPVLQATNANDVWTLWGANWRDVVIVDAAGKKRSVYNLVTYDLGQAENRDAIKKLFVEAGQP